MPAIHDVANPHDELIVHAFEPLTYGWFRKGPPAATVDCMILGRHVRPAGGLRPLLSTAVGVLLIAVIGGCTPEFGSAPPVKVAYATDFELTSDQPVSVLGVRFVAIPGDRTPSVNLYLSVDDRDDPGIMGTRHDDVWLSILDPANGESLSLDPAGGIGHATVDGWGHGVDCNVTGCDRTFAVIARWLKPLAGQSIDLRFSAELTATDPALRWQSLPPLELEEQSIKNVPELAFQGKPATSTAQRSGSFRAMPNWAGETHAFTLNVPAALLEAARIYPRLGRILVTFTATDAGGKAFGYATEFTVGERTNSASAGPISLETEWLSQCPSDETCELPVTLAMTWNPMDMYSSPDPNAFITVDWLIEARLEDLKAGGSVLPGLELVPVPGG